MKKYISVILIILVFINFITIASYAEGNSDTKPGTEQVNDAQQYIKDQIFTKETTEVIDADSVNIIDEIDRGQSEVTDYMGNKKKVVARPGENTNGVATEVNLSIFAKIPLWGNKFLKDTLKHLGLKKSLNGTTVIEQTGAENDEDTVFTVYDTVMGNYSLFDVSYANVSSEKDGGTFSIEGEIKSQVRTYFSKFREIALAASLFAIIYAGVRLAIASGTEEGGSDKYKNMIYNFVISLILISIMNLIIVGLCYVSETFVGMIKEAAQKEQSEMGSELLVNIENTVYYSALDQYKKAGIWNKFTATFQLWIVTYYQIKIFVIYLVRTFFVGFLIMVGPFSIVSYAVSAASGGTAVVFQTWLKEFLLQLSIQIVHATIYLIFIASAAYIAKSLPIFIVLLFALLVRTEKVIRNLFNMGERII